MSGRLMFAEVYHLQPPALAHCPFCNWWGDETEDEELAERQADAHNALHHPEDGQ